MLNIKLKKVITKPLSQREFEILILKAFGISNKGISANFKISERTTRTYIERINEKISQTEHIEAYGLTLVKNDIDLLKSSLNKFGHAIFQSQIINDYFQKISFNETHYKELFNCYQNSGAA